MSERYMFGSTWSSHDLTSTFGGPAPIVFILGLTPIMETARLHDAGPAVVRVKHWPTRFVLLGRASLDNNLTCLACYRIRDTGYHTNVGLTGWR